MIESNDLSIKRAALTELLIFFIVAMLSALIGVLLTTLLGKYLDITSLQESLKASNEANTFAARSTMRMVLMVNHLFLFIIPSLVFARWIHKHKVWQFLKTNLPQRANHWFTSILLIIVSFPFAQFIYWVNKKITLPIFAQNLEESAGQLTKALMVMESPADLAFNLLAIAILPAIGEELVFRGIVQQYLSKILKNPHWGIWGAALLFSAMHLQFEGFMPRLLLGGILGYVFYWSRSLWIPMVAHLVFNSVQIFGKYFYDTNEPTGFNPSEIERVPYGAALLSLLLMTILVYTMHQTRVKETN